MLLSNIQYISLSNILQAKMNPINDYNLIQNHYLWRVKEPFCRMLSKNIIFPS